MYSRVLFVVLLWKFAPISAAWNLHFLKDITSHYSFHSSALNIITCNQHETINLIKMLSLSFQRLINVHSADKPLQPLLDEPLIFLLDLQCPNAKGVLEQVDNFGLFSKPFQWILLNDNITYKVGDSNQKSPDEGESWFWPFIETLNVLADSDVKVVEKGSEEQFTITEVYKIGRNFIKEPLAEWTSQEGLMFVNSKSVVLRRWNLNGIVIPTSIVVTREDSLLHLEDMIDKHIDTTTKVSYNAIRLLGDLLNGSLTYKTEYEWGIYKNGSWTGMTGDFEKKIIEFGASPLFIRQERFGILEYYAAVNPSRLQFIFLSPPLSYSNNVFVMPFDDFVWICCLAMVVISCFVLFIALNYEKTQEGSKIGKKDCDSEVSFSEILVLNIGAICLQGTYAKTNNPPSRIITLFLYLSYMFLYISYSAAIVAILQSSDTSIQTLKDFLKSPLKAGADDVVYSQYYFKTAEDEVRKAIYLKKIAPKGEPPHFLPVEKGVEELRKGFYSYHTEVSGGYYLIQKTFTEHEKCALQELREYFVPFCEPWLVMRKKTPYAEHLKIGIKMYIERGFKSRFARRFYTEKPVCTSKASRFVSVGIVDCYNAFLLLLFGYVAAVLILLLEISFMNYSSRRSKIANVDMPPEFEFFN